MRLNNLSLQDQQDLVSQNGSMSNYTDVASRATADSGGVSLGEATARSMMIDKSDWQVKQTRKQQPDPSSGFDTASSVNGTRSNGWAKAPVSLEIF